MNGPDKTADRDAEDRPWSSPYGPHPAGVDEASGGADNSPFENLSSEERAKVAAGGAETEGVSSES